MVKKGNKRSSKTAYKKNLKFTIVKYIYENNKLPVLPLSYSALSYHLKQLISDGIIFKKGYATWTADMDKWEASQFKKEVQKQHRGTKDIRGHGFQWHLNIPTQYNWYKLKDYLDKKDILYYSQSKVKGIRLLIRKYKVWFYPNSIIIYTPKEKSFYEYTAKNSYQDALFDVLKVINSIENTLHIDLRIDFKYWIKPSKQHYAILRNGLAKEYNDNNKKLYIKADDEKGWLLIDKSLGTDELEGIHPITAKNDIDKVVKPFFNGLKKHFEATGESLTLNSMLEMVKLQQDQIGQLTNTVNQLLYKPKEELKPRDNYFG